MSNPPQLRYAGWRAGCLLSRDMDMSIARQFANYGDANSRAIMRSSVRAAREHNRNAIGWGKLARGIEQ